MIPFAWKLKRRHLARRWQKLSTQMLGTNNTAERQALQRQLLQVATQHVEISARIAQRRVGAA